MNEIQKLGALDALDKIAKSGLHPRAIAGFMQEGGKISKSLASKFRMSPGEINKARKIQRKASRKAAAKAEITRRTQESQLAKTRFSRPFPGEPTKVTGPAATAATKVVKKPPTATGAAEALGL